MSGNPDIEIDLASIAKVAAAMPQEDFINARYDVDCGSETADVLLILSTQRSGSTLLADLIRRSEWCLPHEYFQPYYYLPMLADRWGCIDNGMLDKQSYLEKLRRFRTFSNGWLGINLHGVHLQTFEAIGDFPGDLKMHFVHLQRRDLIAQAVSYEIASQTGKWSSFYEGSGEAKYSYRGIKKRLRFIEEQNDEIRAYLAEKDQPYQSIYYEDLIAEPETTVRGLAGDIVEIPPLHFDTMTKQAGKVNQAWIERFSKRYPVSGSGRT
jgi:LPS sulfotransferase NodH